MRVLALAGANVFALGRNVEKTQNAVGAFKVTVVQCVEESTQKVRLPLLLDLEKTVAAVCGNLSACLISVSAKTLV